MTTAACIIIGDEILTGKIHEANSHTLAKVLFARGVKLRRIEVIPDIVDEIATTVRRTAAAFDHVFTSGGIGPTHDDVTYDGIAQAFHRALVLHAPTVERMVAGARARDPERPAGLNDARRRMAMLPIGCTVWETPGLWVPLVVVENVHVLPGIPALFTQMLEANAHHFHGPALYRALVFTNQSEGDLAAPLAALATAYPHIAFGSYPRDASNYKVMISIEGEDERAVADLAERVRASTRGFFIEGVTTHPPGSSQQ